MNIENLKIKSYLLYEPNYLNELEKTINTITLERVEVNNIEKWEIKKLNFVFYKDSMEFMFKDKTFGEKNYQFKSPEEALNFWVKKVEPKFEEKLKQLQVTEISHL